MLIKNVLVLLEHNGHQAWNVDFWLNLSWLLAARPINVLNIR